MVKKLILSNTVDDIEMIVDDFQQKLYKGMKVLGVIKDVNEFDLAISLPNGLTGFVSITDINDKVTEKLQEELQAKNSQDDEVSLTGSQLINGLFLTVYTILLSNERTVN